MEWDQITKSYKLCWELRDLGNKYQRSSCYGVGTKDDSNDAMLGVGRFGTKISTTTWLWSCNKIRHCCLKCRWALGNWKYISKANHGGRTIALDDYLYGIGHWKKNVERPMSCGWVGRLGGKKRIIGIHHVLGKWDNNLQEQYYGGGWAVWE